MLKPQIAVALGLVALSGCAAIEGIQARDSGNILAEAGFTREAAGAAQGASGSSATTLPARQLTRTAANGATVYQFYDPQSCRCVYIGGEEQFAKLQELRKQRLADHAWYLQRSNAISVAPHPDTWGAWAPAGLDLK